MPNIGPVVIAIGNKRKIRRQIDGFCRTHGLPLPCYTFRPEAAQHQVENAQRILDALKVSDIKKGDQAKWEAFLRNTVFRGADILARATAATSKDEAIKIGEGLGAKVLEVRRQS